MSKSKRDQAVGAPPAAKDVQQMQVEISSYFGRLLRDTFGKGPEAVNVSIGHSFITIYLRNFLTPAEKVLMEQDHEIIVMQMRDKLMEMIRPELIGYIETVTGRKPEEIYYDWELQHRSGMVLGVFPETVRGNEQLQEAYIGKIGIEEEVVRISRQSQKEPEEIFSCEINPRTVVVVRSGILVRIEKELIRSGSGDLLRRIKRKLEKGDLQNNARLESLFQRRIVDSFVDWDFARDKSFIVFVLDPRLQRGGSAVGLAGTS